MKTPSKRTKMLLAIAAIVIVVVVAGGYLLAMNGPAELSLFGTSGAYIDPFNLCVNPGSTRTLTQKNTVLGVNSWSSGNSAIAIIASTTSKTANVKGVAVGQTYVRAKGTFFSDTATVLVNHVCPATTEMAPNTSIRAVTDLTAGQWKSDNPTIAVVGSDGTVHSKSLGATSIYYVNQPSVPSSAILNLTVTNTPGYYGGW